MCTAKTLPILLAGVALLVPGAVAQDDHPQAKKLLLKVLNRKSEHNVRAFVWQLQPDRRDQLQFQVVISKAGKSRQTITAPLSMSMIEAVDDLSHCYNFYPDQRLLVIQDSARKLDCDADYRLKLAERNYSLRLEPGAVRVAGQPASVVVAIPRAEGMETRKFYIDSRTGFLLKLETLFGNESTTRLETKKISYPSTVAESTFDLDVPKGTQTREFRRPEQFTGPGAASKIGFTPVLAQRGASLPLGFVIQDIQIADNEQMKQLVMRITDGLVRGTVYQMASGKPSSIARIRALPNVVAQDAGSIRIVVAADVPSRAREEILRYFVNRAQSSAEPMAWGRIVLADANLELDYVPLALLEDRGLSAGQTFNVVVPSGKIALRVEMSSNAISAAASVSGASR
jgi:hypothetical protein